MDMYSDIPLADELEWLEANPSFHEDHLDIPSPDPSSPPPPQQRDQQTPSPTNAHKRIRSDASHSLNHKDIIFQSDEKRSRTEGTEPEANDEDWLRYSPPPRDVEQVVVQEERIVSRYASEIDGDFVPVTAPSGGDRVYAKICRVDDKDDKRRKLDFKSQSKSLIMEPIDVLFQRIEQEAFTKALQASSEDQNDIILPEKEVIRERLWVDKYAPSSFTELLSDEQTNREVLLWLKQWDATVFGSEIRSTEDDVLTALRRHSSIAQHKKHSEATFLAKNRGHRWHSGNFRTSSNMNPGKGEPKVIQEGWNRKSKPTGPPEHKILLLCGPPGLGKTTLAHVAAKHCGYRVVEVNASDDRSSARIEAKIHDVVQMDSVMADSRPKCLVIDEIDGALGDGKGVVDVILKMVSAESKAEAGKENVAKGESGRIFSKKGHKKGSLFRPVICICNDLYVPALRSLRQVAKIHVFFQPTVNCVASRLKFICNKEGMRASSIALSALAEYTECDIRSCLNTLQFLNKKNQTLDMFDIGSQVVGRKDMSKGAFDIWKEIFQKRKTKQYNKSNSSMNEFDHLHSLVSNRGDYDVILDGINENILNLQFHDPVMQKTLRCFNSLCVSDLLQQYVMRTQQMHLHVYQPALAIILHRLVAQVQKPNIEWPKSHQRYKASSVEKMDLLGTWKNKILPSISRHLSTKSFVKDLVSPLLHILSPPNLRPVALQILSEKEKAHLDQLISTMVSYSITYKNPKHDPLSHNQEHETVPDAPTLSFDPPLHEFVKFKGQSSCHYVLPLAMKQVLVHEVEKEKILQVNRSGQLIDGCIKENSSLVIGKKRAEQSSVIDSSAAFALDVEEGKNEVNLKGHVPSMPAISSTSNCNGNGKSNVGIKSGGNPKKHSSGSTSFFDRFRKTGSKIKEGDDDTVEKTNTVGRHSHPLLFKFNEGFTNAIKRPVRMRDFMH